MALKPFRQVLDGNRTDTMGIVGQGYVMYSVLAANIAEVVTIPSGARIVSFSSTGNFYANLGAAATVPSVDITDGTGSLLNPGVRDVDGAATIGLIAPAACTVQMEFFS
jgi:hypothetical protein